MSEFLYKLMNKKVPDPEYNANRTFSAKKCSIIKHNSPKIKRKPKLDLNNYDKM